MEITEGAGISLGTAAGERGELGQLWVRCSGAALAAQGASLPGTEMDAKG